MKQLLQKTKNRINNAICNSAPGLFSDEYWHGVQMIWDNLTGICERVGGLVWQIEGSRYETDPDSGAPIRKTWSFSVTDGKRTSYGVLVAAGAGSVADPLSKYDIVSYIS